MLTATFDAIAGGYHFVTTATVNDVVAVTAEGDRVGEGTRVNVTTGGSTVSYAITPEGTWVFSDGSWAELDEPAPAVDPVGALRTPTASSSRRTATVRPCSPARIRRRHSRSPATDPVDVALEIDGTTLRSITYVVDAERSARRRCGPTSARWSTPRPSRCRRCSRARIHDWPRRVATIIDGIVRLCATARFRRGRRRGKVAMQLATERVGDRPRDHIT